MPRTKMLLTMQRLLRRRYRHRLLKKPSYRDWALHSHQRLQHQHQRIALDAFQTLADDVAAHPGLLYQGNAHRDLSFQTDNLVATQGRGKNRRHQWRA